MDAIFPYVKSEELFNCPSHNLPVKLGTSIFDRYKYRTGRNWGSYGVNTSYFDVPSSLGYTNPFQSPAVASWEAPATTIYAVDSAARFSIGWSSKPPEPLNPPIIGTDPRYLYSPFMMVERHLGTCVVLYCDGHAKAQRLEKVTTIGDLGRYSAFTIQADPD